MADPHVVTALVRKRAELTGDIERTHERLRQMVLDLENLDATLRLFDPTHQIEAIRPKAFRPPKDWANRGEMTRIVLRILPQAAEPLTTRDIALELLVTRALDNLGRRDYLRRRRDEADRRNVLVQRTVKGSVFLSDFADRIVAAADQL